MFSWLKDCKPDRTGNVHRHLPYDSSKAEKHAKFCYDNIERAAQHLNHEKMKADQQQEVRERHQRALEKVKSVCMLPRGNSWTANFFLNHLFLFIFCFKGVVIWILANEKVIAFHVRQSFFFCHKIPTRYATTALTLLAMAFLNISVVSYSVFPVDLSQTPRTTPDQLPLPSHGR